MIVYLLLIICIYRVANKSNVDESLPLLTADDNLDNEDMKNITTDWNKLATAIDRFCYIILPVIFIVFNIQKFKAVGVM